MYLPITNYLKQSISNDAILKVILFFFWPFGAFLYALRKPSSRSSYLIYFTFGLLFCWSMYFKSKAGEYIDFETIVLRFYDLQVATFSQLISDIWSIVILDFSTNGADFYLMTVNWITRQFTSNFHLMYVIVGIPVLYFMLGSLKYITNDKSTFNSSVYCYIILVLFILPCSIFSVQNYRFATALWISVFCFIKLFYEDKRKYLLLLLLTPYIHYSFWVIVVVIVTYFLVKKTPKIIRLLFYISIPLAFIPTGIVSLLDLSVLPVSLLGRSETYMSETAQADWGMYSNGVRSLFKAIQMAVCIIATVIMIRSRKKSDSEKEIQALFWVYVTLFSITNFINVIPVIGERFFLLCRILCVFLWFKLIYPSKNSYLIILFLSCALDFYTMFGLYLLVLSGDFFYSNLFFLIVKYWGITTY